MRRSSPWGRVLSVVPSCLAAALLALAGCGGPAPADEVTAGAAVTIASAPADRSACHRWQSCVPENPCHTGWVTGCRAGVPICTDIGGWLDNGATCGTDQVCFMGQCVPCTAGKSCQPKDANGNPVICAAGVTSCASGQEVCEGIGPAPDGWYCYGPDQPWSVCAGGQCTYCPAGSQCAPAEAPCHLGTITCNAGPDCVDTGTPAPDGTWCGTDQTCRGGECVSCPWYQPCAPAGQPCWTGYTTCYGGSPACQPSSPKPDGTPCGDGLFCSGGTCAPPCQEGQACTPYGNACAIGTMTCSSTYSGYCQQTGTVPDGTGCGPGGAVCTGGICAPPPCNPGAPCAALNGGACRTWTIACSTGAPVCAPSGFAPDGTSCGPAGETCAAGTCTGTAGAPIVVRTASGGTADLTGTTWTTCFPNEPSPGLSRWTSDAFAVGGLTHREEIYVASTDCTGLTDPQRAWTVTASVATAGDRLVGWLGSVPPGFGATVIATGIVISGIDPKTQQPLSIKDLLLLDDRASPRLLYGGDDDPPALDPEGFSTVLLPGPAVEAAACTPGVPCVPPSSPCEIGVIACSAGAPVCTGTGTFAPDGASCGSGLTCQLGQCLPAVIRTVTGARTLTYWPDAGPTAPQPANLTSVSALVPAVLGGYEEIPGSVAPDGTYAIPGVPQGSYLLDAFIGYHVLVDTAAGEVDLGEDRLGRAAATAPAGTILDLSIDGLDPWNAQDHLRVVASNAGLLKWAAGAPPVPAAVIPAGATAATVSPSWSGFPLLDGAQGDRAYVLQSATGTLPGTTLAYQAASRYGSLPADLALVPGGPLPAAASLQPAPAQGTLTASWPTADYEAYRAALCPSPPSSASHRLAVLAKPHAEPLSPVFTGSELYLGSAAPDLFWATAPLGTPPVEVASSYGRFLPDPWAEFFETRFSVACPVAVPGLPAASQVVHVGRVDPIAAAPAVPLPLVSPVTAVTVGGLDGFAGGSGVGVAPEIAWSPPALLPAGVPVYTVTVLRPFVPTGGTQTLFQLVALARTTATRLQLPPLLQAGERYLVRVEVRVTDAERVEAPLRKSFVAGYATMVTAPFSP